VQFLLAPAFLLEVTVSLRLNAGALAWRPWQKVALEEPLETLCRLLMREVVIASEGHRRSLAEIALAAGFADQAHLTRHFQRVFGQTPGHWRDQTDTKPMQCFSLTAIRPRHPLGGIAQDL
jgi:AraC-like DNA-binding protein